MMANEHALNPTDGMLQPIRDPLAQETLMVDNVSVPNSPISALVVNLSLIHI